MSKFIKEDNLYDIIKSTFVANNNKLYSHIQLF